MQSIKTLLKICIKWSKIKDTEAIIPAFNAEINEVKDKIPSITNLAAAATLSAVENSRLWCRNKRY